MRLAEAQETGNVVFTTGVVAGPTAAMSSALTILITNAPTPNDPDLSMVQSALGSVIDNAPGTIAVPKVFAFDGMPDDLLAERKATYQAKIRAIEKHIADNVDNTESMWYNARTCEKPTNGRLSGLLNYSLVECVTTPLVFIQQHDLELTKPVRSLPGLDSGHLCTRSARCLAKRSAEERALLDDRLYRVLIDALYPLFVFMPKQRLNNTRSTWRAWSAHSTRIQA